MKVTDFWNKKFEMESHFGTGPTGFAKECERFLKNKGVKKILDLGCGQGRDSKYFVDQEYDVTAVDFSEKALKSIKDKRIKIIQRNVQDLSIFPDHSFDVVYSNLVLHLFRREVIQKIIDQIYRILKPEGFLLFTGKNKKDKLGGKGEKIAEQTFVYKGVLRFYFKTQDLKALLKDFEIIKMEEESHIQFGEKPSVYWKVFARKK